LTEYNAGGFVIGLGTFAQSTVLNLQVGNVLNDSDIQAELRSIARRARVKHPPPHINDLYFVLTPPNVQVNMGGTSSCSSFCGYHNDISGGIYYAVIPYPACAGCANGGSVFGSITMHASHELAEAITDPIPGAGWYDNQSGEIGDFCNAQPKNLGGYVVQKIWSAQHHQCV
jgi:hypothetical protein